MKCYICDTEMIETLVFIKDEEVPALKCPYCNDSYTTLIDAKDLFKTS